MGILSRLFGRGAGAKQPANEASPLPQHEQAAAMTASTEEPARSPDPVETTAPTAPQFEPPPLRSLTRYRNDPAFNNFQARLRRPPGSRVSASGRRPDLEPPRGPER